MVQIRSVRQEIPAPKEPVLGGALQGFANYMKYYNANQQQNADRAYDQSVLDDQRMFQTGLLGNQRAYNEKITGDTRSYNEKITGSNRTYDKLTLEEQRKYDKLTLEEKRLYDEKIKLQDTLEGDDDSKNQQITNYLMTLGQQGVTYNGVTGLDWYDKMDKTKFDFSNATGKGGVVSQYDLLIKEAQAQQEQVKAGLKKANPGQIEAERKSGRLKVYEAEYKESRNDKAATELADAWENEYKNIWMPGKNKVNNPFGPASDPLVMQAWQKKMDEAKKTVKTQEEMEEEKLQKRRQMFKQDTGGPKSITTSPDGTTKQEFYPRQDQQAQPSSPSQSASPKAQTQVGKPATPSEQVTPQAPQTIYKEGQVASNADGSKLIYSLKRGWVSPEEYGLLQQR